jgi:hypothetical protein
MPAEDPLLLLGMYANKRNWRKLILIYGVVAIVLYGGIYLLFFSGLFGGGHSATPLGY